MTSLSTTLIVAAIASVWAVTSPLSASCASAFAGEAISSAPAESSAFVAQINELRASKGLSPLAVNDNLASVAQDWALHMGQQEAISHRSNLAAGVTVDWRKLGENVARAPEVDQAMNALITSPTHYRNMTDPDFTHIGVGTVRTPDGELYTAHEFATIKSAAPAPTPRPSTTAPVQVVTQAAAPAITTPAPAAASTTAEPIVEVEHSVSQASDVQNALADAEVTDGQLTQTESRGRSC